MSKTFKEKVFEVVKSIPPGKVLSYKKVAELAGNPKAFRLVGYFLSQNEDPQIPCHRVICSNGELGGYRWGVLKKAEKLEKEGASFKGKNNKVFQIYYELLFQFSLKNSQWEKWCKKEKTTEEKEEIIIEAVLTQRTNWRNVELAMENLRKENLNTLKALYGALKSDKRKIEKLIKPAGFSRQKAEFLFNVLDFFIQKYKGNLQLAEKETKEDLREKLLSVKGVGKETADSILLYVFKKPVFIIDEYTRRLVRKYDLLEEKSYEKLQDFFEKNLPKNWRLFQKFHALIVIAGKNKFF